VILPRLCCCNRSEAIQHTATSSDANYDGIAIDPVNVNIADNDNDDNLNSSVIITQTDDSINVTEGDKTLTFTTQNWNLAQNVTVTAVYDAIVTRRCLQRATPTH